MSFASRLQEVLLVIISKNALDSRILRIIEELRARPEIFLGVGGHLLGGLEDGDGEVIISDIMPKSYTLNMRKLNRSEIRKYEGRENYLDYIWT